MCAALGTSRTTFGIMVREGRIPAPLALGPRTRRWPASVLAELAKRSVA